MPSPRPPRRSTRPAGADHARAPAGTVARARRRWLRAVLAGAGALAGLAPSAAGGGELPAAGLAGGSPLTLGEAGVPRLSVLALDGDGSPRWRRDFEHADLLALPQHSLVATTPWHGQPQRFGGPLLRDVLAAAGARGERLTAVGLNDYRADIPLEDIERWPVIVALQVDGQPVAVRDKGPLMLMYPFDDDRSLRRARYFARAVWQLRTIELR
jgi:hypothetical protein